MTVQAESYFNKVCQALGYIDSAGFLQEISDTKDLKHQAILKEAKEKLGIDAVYLIQTAPNARPVPVIYFKKFQSMDLSEIKNLHKKIWNQGRAPILFVISPVEIRVYDCCEPPSAESLGAGIDMSNQLVKQLQAVVDAEEIRRNLDLYTREKIDRGGFWCDEANRFNVKNRADQRLLRNLKDLRAELHQRDLDYKNIHSLIGRSIFILFLEDRNILISFFSNFKQGKYSNKKFRDILQSKDDTYELFKIICKRFNGDMFPVTEEEEEEVTQEHLNKLRLFLKGASVGTGQIPLWPYRFDIIPIEFISSVYEEFLSSERKKIAAHYTPLFLADFLLDQVLPSEIDCETKVLDPSCGSGIFLVAAFRRIVEAKIAQMKKPLAVNDVRDILKNNIYGIDIDGEAIRVAAFSLYLAMLDYIDPQTLWQYEQLFPPLINKTLFVENFVTSSNEILKKVKFSIVIGNTPWGSTLNSNEMTYCKNRGWIIGDRQIAQAFLWKALEIDLAPKVCLIVTAKGVLFNRNPKNTEFRNRFLRGIQIQSVINFSALRYDIFENAIGPAAAIIFCRKQATHQDANISYVVPKPSLEARKLEAIFVDYTDIKEIPKSVALENDAIWKSAMWGTPRDWNMIDRLSSKQTLRNVVDYPLKWKKSEGFRLTGSDHVERAEWMKKYPLLPLKDIKKYAVSKKILVYNHNFTEFNRPRSEKIYKAPLCLIKESPKRGEIVAAYSEIDLCYDEHIIGIAGKEGDEPLLKILTCILNSSFARYVLFLTSSSWGIERDYILVDEFNDIPMRLPDKTSEMYTQIVKLYDEAAKLAQENKENSPEWKKVTTAIDNCIFDLFEVSESDRDIVLGTLNYTLKFFEQRENSIVCKQPFESELLDYANRFQSIINTMLMNQEKAVNAEMSTSLSKNLVVASFTLGFNKTSSEPKLSRSSTELETSLENWFRVKNENISEKVYVSRILKIFEGNIIRIIKPNEVRYWTPMLAYNDADDIIAEILEDWSERQLA